MRSIISKFEFFMHRLNERLWVRPIVYCILSIGGALLAHAADQFEIPYSLPEITQDSLQSLLSIIASSMLMVATFSVSSMVSAYNSAAQSATPRSFPVVVSDDVSKNALSVFIGAFIYSIVALIAMQNSYYGDNGKFMLFIITLLVFAWVVLTLVRWFDKVARLGRLETVVNKLEKVTQKSLQRNRHHPNMDGVALKNNSKDGNPVTCKTIGYIQHINVSLLQEYAEDNSLQIILNRLPGSFVTPEQPLCFYFRDESTPNEFDHCELVSAFQIGEERVFENDPRFGLVTLSEIASRALSPAVNDPGTAIGIIGTFVRLLSEWAEPVPEEEREETSCSRIQVPDLSVDDMFDDAFTGIARDGSELVEVHIRLQKAFASLNELNHKAIKSAAEHHSQLALKRAKQKLSLHEDIELIESVADWSSINSTTKPDPCEEDTTVDKMN